MDNNTTIIKNVVNLIPIVVPISLMFNSIMNASLRGFFYTFGSMLTVLFNKILSKCVGDYVRADIIPNYARGGEDGLFGLFDNDVFPDPIATFMAFTTSYVAISPIFINPFVNKINKGLWALTQLLFLTLLISLIRVRTCHSTWVSVFCGWFLGCIIGFVWYSTIGYLSKYEAGFTYFENDTKKKCKINGNSYTCSSD
jgi:membrane-associated phospholipid phosphatase